MFSELDSSLFLLFISQISESEHEITGYHLSGPPDSEASTVEGGVSFH